MWVALSSQCQINNLRNLIKFYILALNDCEDINNDHSFTGLDDFAEIPTNFVIESITETDNAEVADEIEISYDTTEDKDSIQQDIKKELKCQKCDKVYSHQQSLQNHLKKCHGEQKGIHFMCSHCDRSFNSERKLKLHQQVHLPEEEKLIHPCPISDCDRKFTKSVNVQAHIKSVHVKERPYLCSNCGKNFSTKGALKEHQIIHSDQFPYACKFCPKKFKNLPRLKTHEDIHSTTQYICPVCGISLNTKRTLKMHMVIHSDQKKFKCEYCQTSFKRSKALKNHLILHSGLRPYSCPFCDKTFANGSNCRSHKKKAHPAELAAFEAAGKKASSPNIPRLEQLMTK